jgi:hypothetical protein
MQIEKKVNETFEDYLVSNIFLFLVSEDLFQKATELKLRLHMQSTTDKSLLIQRSLDQAKMKESCYNTSPRKSMVNLSSLKNSSMVNLKDKPRIPMIRDKSAPPNSILTRRTTMAGQNEMNLGKIKLKSLEEKYRKTIKKQRKFISILFIFD